MSVADDYPMLHTPGKAKSYRPASGKGCAKSAGQAQRRVPQEREPENCGFARALMAVSEMNDRGHNVFFARSDRNIKASAYHEGSGTKLELERVNGVFELSVVIAPYSQSTSKNGTLGSCSSFSAVEQIKEMMVRAASVDHPN